MYSLACTIEAMDSLYDLLAGKDFDQPTEIATIKDFVRSNYNAEAQVQLSDKAIIVQVGSAPLASRLRFDLPKLKEKLKTDKRIILRIS